MNNTVAINCQLARVFWMLVFLSGVALSGAVVPAGARTSTSRNGLCPKSSRTVCGKTKFSTQRRKGAKKTFRSAVALSAPAPLRRGSSSIHVPFEQSSLNAQLIGADVVRDATPTGDDVAATLLSVGPNLIADEEVGPADLAAAAVPTNMLATGAATPNTSAGIGNTAPNAKHKLSTIIIVRRNHEVTKN